MRATQRLYLLTAVVFLACLARVTPAAAPDKPADEQQLRERALKLNEITGQAPIVGQIIALLDDKEGSRKLVAAAHKLAKEKAKDKEPPFNVNATYILARTAAGLKEVDISKYFYEQHADQTLKLGSSLRFIRAYYDLIDLLMLHKRYAEAEKVGQKFLEEDNEKLRDLKLLVLRRMVQTQAKQGKIKEALKTTETLIKARPDLWLTHDLKGWVLREAGRYAEAAQVYEGIIELVGKNRRLDKEQRDEIIDDVRYRLSGLYVDLKQIDKAADHLKALLSKDKDNPTYNNDLGFIWADHDMNLDEAEKLIRKAIEEDRKLRRKINPEIKPEQDTDNAAYLDSLGWVLYKQKRHKDALAPLLAAIKQPEGQHLEIYDHLAEVYISLGQTDKAVEAWKKGLTCEPITRRDNQRKLEVEKKIKKHQSK